MRKLRNNSPEMDRKEKGMYLTQMALDMRRSGHEEHFRVIVLAKAAAKYKAMLEEHQSGVKNMYRSREDRENEKEDKEGSAGEKESWFKGECSDTSNHWRRIGDFDEESHKTTSRT